MHDYTIKIAFIQKRELIERLALLEIYFRQKD